HVLSEVGAGRALERATRGPGSTVVHAQHRDPAAPQRIRELAEGPKPWAILSVPDAAASRLLNWAREWGPGFSLSALATFDLVSVRCRSDHFS
ncbi:MAG TPA: hypothetical protein VJ023_19840, partial [Pyrinomonadaceae bacterium]|nr:hypothetical protein [Pyrinomonadaceae bacterium]